MLCNDFDCFDFESVTRTNDTFGRELTRINLHDPAYPLYGHAEFSRRPANVMWWNSGRRLFTTNLVRSPWSEWLRRRCCFRRQKCLSDAFFWRLGQGNVVPDHRTNQYARHQGSGFQDWRAGGSISAIPSFVLSLDGPPVENSGRVLAGSLKWLGQLNACV